MLPLICHNVKIEMIISALSAQSFFDIILKKFWAFKMQRNVSCQFVDAVLLKGEPLTNTGFSVILVRKR
jgi:hypothetical protein